MCQRFGSLVEQTIAGGLQSLGLEPSPCLALVLLLDQFSRQLWRDEARAFAGDERAPQLSDRAPALSWIALELLRPGEKSGLCRCCTVSTPSWYDWRSPAGTHVNQI